MTLPSIRSTTHLSLSQQAETLSAKSAQSVVSIMWLNETLPPYMTHDYMLAPFAPTSLNDTIRPGNLTASTLMYSVNVDCETPISWDRFGIPMVNSSWGCSTRLPLPDVTLNEKDPSKVFSTVYAGYFNEDGLADYYLSGYCPQTENNTFLVQWAKTLVAVSVNQFVNLSATEQVQHANVTTLFCRSSYFVQEVDATVLMPNYEVLGYVPVGEAQSLPASLFNTSNFEASMNMGHERFRVRTDFPTTNWPSQTAFLANVPLDLSQLSTMAPFAIGALQLPLDEYLDPKKLASSYQAAYRLLFARQMVDVLSPSMNPESQHTGQFSYQTQSVVLVPAFTYIVEALLIAASVFAAIILYNSRTRVSKLHFDPATISAMMSLAADDTALLNKLKSLDQANEEELGFHIRNRRFRLCTTQDHGAFHRLQLLDMRGNEPIEAFNDELQASKRQKNMQSLREGDDSKAGFVSGLQPTEFKAKMGLAFLASQIGLFAAIAALFVTIQNRNGLPLPTTNRFVRQLLENYLPTAIGTFIEPFWVVLNRHLCFLQPFDELRKGRKIAQKSLNLEYSSLPPQLTIVKALSNGNILLGIVCTMALLANGLAIALSGLFFENTVNLETGAKFVMQYASQFRPLDGAAGPFITEHKQSLESVYIATSNRTAHTPLPPWTDDRFFYFPMAINSSLNNSNINYHAEIPVIGAELRCQALSPESTFSVLGSRKDEIGHYSIPPTANLSVSLRSDHGDDIICVARDSNSNITFGGPIGPSAYEFIFALDGIASSSASEASFCREHIAAGWVRSTLMEGTRPANQSALTWDTQTIITSHDETIISCRSVLMAGVADVLVSADGHVQQRNSQNTSSTVVKDFLSTTSSDLVSQANQIIFANVEGIYWHNDSLPSDFPNYLVEKATNSSSHLDPSRPPPSVDAIVPPFNALYSQLFATLIGRNMGLLLKPVNERKLVDGFSVEPTIRIYMSKPMFVIAETILTLYIIVTIILYLRRPWKMLCRMPASLASVIAFVAASHTIKDFRGTAAMTDRHLRDHVQKLGDRYGFGTFVGTDNETHIGVEKHPFLAPLMKENGLARQNPDDNKRSLRDKWRSRFAQWKSGKVREGGLM